MNLKQTGSELKWYQSFPFHYQNNYQRIHVKENLYFAPLSTHNEHMSKTPQNISREFETVKTTAPPLIKVQSYWGLRNWDTWPTEPNSSKRCVLSRKSESQRSLQPYRFWGKQVYNKASFFRDQEPVVPIKERATFNSFTF